MSLNRKYAALPDLDSAPDTYETPELTDDNSTSPTGRARSESTVSSYKDFDEEEDDKPGIYRSRLDPDEARSLFSPAQIDARDVDFSDRVSAKRKSYKASTRRQRKHEDGTEEFGDLSDDEDGESLERRFARLRREIEEVKEAYSRKNAEKANSSGGEDGMDGQDIAALTKLLDGISTNQPPRTAKAGAKLARDIGTGIKANIPLQSVQASEDPATYTITYAPTYQQSHALAKAADFDSRLALLEKVLGLNTTDLPTNNGVNTLAILPTLETLFRQISLLTDATPTSLDSISRRVRSLTQEADRLEESRRQAKAAQDALKAGGEAIPEEDSEQVAKINALYGTLSTIDNLAPLLPSVLDRLRSLRAIHADAATASESLERVEKRQADMAEEIKKWSHGLANMEEKLKKGETLISGNMKVVEEWVKELEARIAKL
ncbi:Dynamitin-domain-containing protein [Bisporella sp. PMI_857]|nr:Dynamitin-domain-containing protein [Bisporella sp. PMI_857]